MQNTSRSNEVLISMQTWRDNLRRDHEKPKYAGFFPLLNAFASSFSESSAAEEQNITDINYVAKQLGLRDIRSLSTKNIEIIKSQNWRKCSAWLFNQNTPHKFIVVENDIESHQKERLEWLAGINFICLLEWIINELIQFKSILTGLFSDAANTAEVSVNNHSYDLLIKFKFKLKNLNQLKETNYTQAELDELKKILGEFCVDEANKWPLRQVIDELLSSASIPNGCRETLTSYINVFFNTNFSDYKAKMNLFKNRADNTLKEKQEELNNKNRGRVFKNPIEALAYTRLGTSPNASTKISLTEKDIEDIDEQLNNKIRNKTEKNQLQKQLLRVHNHASKLHRRHQWKKNWKKNRFYRFIISLLLSSNNHDLEQQKYTVLYQVIKLFLENNLDQIKKIKSDSIPLLCQHRSRWRRAHFNSGMTTSLRELDQLEKLLS